MTTKSRKQNITALASLLDEQSKTSTSTSGSIHMKQAGYIMGQSKNIK